MENEVVFTDLEELIKRVVYDPVYFYTKIGEALTESERLYLVRNLINKSCLTCTNSRCQCPYSKRAILNQDGTLAGNECDEWENSLLVGKSKVLGLKDVNVLR